MGKLQDQDFKTLAELTGAGATAASLLNDTKIYVTANSLNKQLSQAITDGDIGGGSGGAINLITNSTADQNTNGWATYNDTETATLTIASPSVVTVPSTTGYYSGMPFCFTTTGALPTGVTAGTTYYVTTVVSGTTFRFSATLGGADVNTSGSQSGTHTFRPLVPINGTGGSANITWTRTTTTPLRGNGSFLFTKDANNRAGEGVSYDFTVPLEYRSKVLQTQIAYIINTGTFIAGGATTNSDIQIWMYDVTNSSLIQMTTFKLFSSSTQVADNFISNFQTSASGSTYRICFHVSSNSTSAFTAEFDDVTVSPTTLSYGTPITDWSSYVPTFTQLGTVTNYFAYWRRVGGDVELHIGVEAAAAGSSEIRISLPPGMVVASAPRLRSGVNSVGSYFRGGTAVDNHGGPVLVRSGETFICFGTSYTYSGATIDPYSIQTSWTGAGLYHFIQASIPIQGWSAQVQSSDVNDQRIVAAVYRNSANKTVNGTTPMDFDTRVVDTHSAVTTGSGWRFTAPISGNYQIATTLVASSTTTPVLVYKNGVALRNITSWNSAGTNSTVHGSTIVDMVAGDYIDIRTDGTGITGAYVSSSILCSVSISRIANPASITSTESVGFRAERTTAVSVPTSYTALIPNTVIFDTHGAYNSSTGIYTVPSPGMYLISAQSSVDPSSGQEVQMRIFAAGVAVAQAWGFSSDNRSANGTAIVRVNAGDQIYVQHQASITLNTITTAGARPFISAARIGI